jgi:hypothetical protein
MGRVWRFLNQDSDAAIDRLLRPYADFTRSHPILDALITAAFLVIAWSLVSRTAALVVLGLWIAFTLPALVIAVGGKRRH